EFTPISLPSAMGRAGAPYRWRVLASVLALKQLPLPPAHCAGPCTPQVPPPTGDNKWSKVKHIKGPREAKHNPLFQKLVMLLHFAHKGSGTQP
ncbi:unnamed protein product, partial [Natator depressus]